MGFFISAMLSSRGRAYLHETECRGQICTPEAVVDCSFDVHA